MAPRDLKISNDQGMEDMRVKALLAILIAAVLAAGGVVAVTSAQTGGGSPPPGASLFKTHAQPAGIKELKTHARAEKGGANPRIAYAFARPVKIPANNGRFVRLVCPRKSVAINYQEATRARNVYVDYSAVSPGSDRKWDVGFENPGQSGATVKAGVVCGKDL